MSYCGRSVKGEVKGGLSVKQVEDQLVVLLFAVEREGICHRDITAGNLLWHPEKGLHLADFGWSTWVGEDDSPIPVPHVMRPWMCGHTSEEQVVETMKKLREVEVVKP
jgi:serine/threonine protein kinase